MGVLELVLIGIGLSMDAFAVSVCKGLGMRTINIRHCLLIALFFGGFQALMPVLGWLLGRQFRQYIASVDHWIAFGLLTFLGIKMLVDAAKERREEVNASGQAGLAIGELFMLAVATSIDALAVGVTFAFLQVRIAQAAALIGCVTFVISVGGVFIGNLFGSRFQNKATVLGGLILIAIGAKILLEDLRIW